MDSQLLFGEGTAAPPSLAIRPAARTVLHHVVALQLPDSCSGASIGEQQSHAWPLQVGSTLSISQSRRILCVGPAEWVAVGFADLSVDAIAMIAVEVTQGFAQLHLSGERVEALLCGVCGLDVCVQAFAPGTCARTSLAGIRTLIERRGSLAFDCYIPRSYLSYVLAALRECERAITGFVGE